MGVFDLGNNVFLKHPGNVSISGVYAVFLPIFKLHVTGLIFFD